MQVLQRLHECSNASNAIRGVFMAKVSIEQQLQLFCFQLCC